MPAIVGPSRRTPGRAASSHAFDPLDPQAVAFWKNKVDEVYRAIPDLAGFVLKADSEGRLGPSEYGRTHADAANAIARALQSHGGILFYRGFVYDHMMDWRNLKNDRATAAYDNLYFRIKVAAMVLAAVNAFVYHRFTERRIAEWDAGAPPGGARLAGLVSICVWLVVIVSWRMMSYTMF